MSTSISILGNTGCDVSLRYTEQGAAVATFSIASNTFRKTPEGKQKKTDWFNVTAFGKLAENLATTVRKGSHILVRGKLTFKPWLSRNNEPRVSADVILQDFELAGSRAEETEIPDDNPMEDSLDTADVDASSAAQIPAETENEPFVNQF